MKSSPQRIKILLFCLSLLLTFFAWRTLLKPGYFSMHDDMQAFRLLEMDKCFQDSQIPCRWIPDGGFGYGYPLFNYYPPFPFYLGELIHFLGFSILQSIKIVFILGFLAAAATMFFLGSALWGPWGGFLSSVFYTFAPYHAVDIYARGALNEFWALAWLPAIFWAIFRFVRTEKKKYLLFFSLFYGLLFLTHNPTVLIFTPVAVGWLFLNLAISQKWRPLPRFILPSFLSVGLSAFFLLPVLFEKNLVHVETMLMGYFNYLAHFVSLGQLFFSRRFGYGASVWGMDDNLSFQIGWPHWWLTFLIVLLFALFLKKKKNHPTRFRVFFIFLFGLLAAFFTHSRSTFFWKVIKPLEYLQFPWRFLSLVIFSFSLLAGGLPLILKKRQKILAATTLLLAFLAIILNVSYFKEDIWYWDLTDQQKFSDPKGWQNQITSGIFDYLPKSAQYPPAQKAPPGPEFTNGDGKITHLKKGTNWLDFKVQTASKEAQLRLPVYYFPNWEVKLNGQPIKFDYENKLGLPTFDITPGEHKVEAHLENTPIRTFSNYFSLFSWLAFFFLAINPKRKKMIKYKK
jgi:hypothetical protein